MAHIHIVNGTDIDFIINPVTRTFTNNTNKTQLIQFDHNSERLTFELPRYIDGHDMSLCNKAEVHYINIGNDSTQNKGVYTIDDVAISLDDDNVVTFSWLISANATQLVGSLNFLIRFICLTDDVIEYAWHTNIYSSIKIKDSINNSEEVVEQYADVLEQWKRELEEAAGSGSDFSKLTERVTSLEIPASETMVEKTLWQLYEEGKVSTNPACINGNTFYSSVGGDAATISLGGSISFSIESNTNVSVSIDGNAFDGTSYEGYADKLCLRAENFVSGSITFASIKVAEYKGGVVTAEQAKTIINTKVFTEAEKSVVSQVSNIKDAGYVLSDKTLSDLYDKGKLVIDTSVTTIEAPSSSVKGGRLVGGTSATINFDCNVYINLRRRNGTPNFTAIVDDVVLEGDDIKKYTGYASVLQITTETDMNIAFIALQTSEYNGGYMTADSVKDIEKIKSDIGDIETALDSIISIQESLIGGGTT